MPKDDGPNAASSASKETTPSTSSFRVTVTADMDRTLPLISFLAVVFLNKAHDGFILNRQRLRSGRIFYESRETALFGRKSLLRTPPTLRGGGGAIPTCPPAHLPPLPIYSGSIATLPRENFTRQAHLRCIILRKTQCHSTSRRRKTGARSRSQTITNMLTLFYPHRNRLLRTSPSP
jgi:hypothetical protein